MKNCGGLRTGVGGVDGRETRTGCPIAIDLDSSFLQLIDGARVVGTLRKKGESFDLHALQLHENEVAEVAAAIDAYADRLASLDSLAYDLPGQAKRHEALAALEQIPGRVRTRVHLACGLDVRPTWLNIDYLPEASEIYREADRFLNWDLRAGLPLPDASVTVIYSSHFFEHLTFPEAQHLVGECRRVLQPGGRFRTMLPSFALVFSSYSNGDAEIFREAIDDWHLLDGMPPSQRGRMDVMSRAVFEGYTHKYLYDAENFATLLSAGGFVNVRETPFEPEIDNQDPVRIRFSFYMDAQRPEA